MSETVQAARFSTATLADAECSAQWETWNRRTLVGLRCRTPDGRGLRGDEVNLDLPELGMARVRAQRHRAVRDAALVEQAPTDAVVVYAVLRGRSIFTSRAGSGRLEAGEATVVDGDLPFDRSFPTAFAELVLTFPQALYADRFGAGHRPAARPTRLAGLAGVRVGVIARHLAGPIETLDAADPPDLQSVALDLLTDLTDRAAPGERCAPGDRAALARLLIHQHLADPTLSGPKLARWLDISSRQLTRMFAAHGTSFPAVLTERRLAQASSMLRTLPDRPVGEIATSCGFASASYFTRVFARHHGVTPREYRAG